MTVRVYTRAWCGYCTAALRLLRSKDIGFETIDVTGDPAMRRWLAQTTGRSTVPQIFIDDRPVGGYRELRELDQRGQLESLRAR